MRRAALLFSLLSLLLLPSFSDAEERILLYKSSAEVHKDSSMTVTEEITVNVEGRQIRRGIFRDFPTTYRTLTGGTMRTGFDVRETLLDGVETPFKTESRSNGVRVYIGDPDDYAPMGRHTYTMVYDTTYQVGFFEGHDELYWNVTGNDWDFAIDEARFTLEIPGDAAFNSVEFYTGWQGSKGQDAEVLPGDIVRTTAPLSPGEGLTVVYTWPKGIVTPPEVPLFIRFFDRYRVHFVIALPLALALLYYLLWLRWGKDPPMPTIIPVFAATEGRTPGFLRYVRRMGMDNTCFAADLLNLAVKGHVKIEDRTPEGGLLGLVSRLSGRDLAIRRLDGRTLLTATEDSLLTALLPGRRDELALKQDNHMILSAANSRLKDQYKKGGKGLFSRNTLLWATGPIIPILGCVLLFAGEQEEAGALYIALTIFLTVMGFLLKHSILTFREGRGFFKKLFKKFLPGVLALATSILVLSVLGPGMLFVALSALASALIMALFHELMTVRTPEGNRVLAEAEGLAMYMGTAERHRLEMFNPPEETPEVFESLLPYAFALGVAETWANRFADILREKQYQPTWYSGGNIASFYTGAAIADMTSSVSGAIASASTAPGSSSGSGGGGSSGGGGGGGGGGGW